MNPAAPVLDKVVQSQLMTSDGWRYRRLLVFSVAWFLCALIAVVTLLPAPSGIAPAVLAYAFPALMGLVLSYVFGAFYDDKDKRARAERLGAPLSPSNDEGDADSSQPLPPAR